MSEVSELYKRKFRRKVGQYNKPMQLPAYFAPMIGDKKSVVIAELGAGPINTIGNSWPGVEVRVVPSDILWPEYAKMWESCGEMPITPVSMQDFEDLSYPDAMFDIVHVVNALDHSGNPKAALREIMRVCKPGGWVYLRHSPMQMNRFGGHHQWNIYIEEKDSCVVFQGKRDTLYLNPEFKTTVEDGLIVSICQKI